MQYLHFLIFRLLH